MIFLTGATGFVGGRLLARLAQQRTPARCLVRTPAQAARLRARGFEAVVGDLRQPGLWAADLAGCRAVLHLAAVLGQDARLMDQVNHRGTAGLVRAARRAGVRRFVHVSTFGAKPVARFPYAHSAWRAEQAVRAGAPAWTVLRPTVVVGKGDPFSAGLLRMIRRWPGVVLPAGGRLRVQPLWVEDLVTCLVRGVESKAVRGRALPLAGPQALSLREMSQALMRALGVNKPLLSLPRGWLKLLARHGPASLPWAPGHLLSRDHVVDRQAGAQAWELFGFSPRPFVELVPDLVR